MSTSKRKNIMHILVLMLHAGTGSWQATLSCYVPWAMNRVLVHWLISMSWVETCVFLISCTWSVQHFMEGHAKSGPIPRLPLVTISEPSNLLRDVPVCQVTNWSNFFFHLHAPFSLSKQFINFVMPAIPSGAKFLQPGKPCGSVSS